MNAVVVQLSSAVLPETVTKLSFAVFELRACLSHEMPMNALAAPFSLKFANSESLALRCVITEPLTLFLLRSAIFESLSLRSAITESLALSLLTVAQQSFAVSKLRACLLLPNDAVVALLSLPGIASELFWSA